MEVIPVVVGALNTIPRPLEKHHKEIRITDCRGEIATEGGSSWNSENPVKDAGDLRLSSSSTEDTSGGRYMTR